MADFGRSVTGGEGGVLDLANDYFGGEAVLILVWRLMYNSTTGSHTSARATALHLVCFLILFN